MTGGEYLYYAALLFVAPLAAFNRVAAVLTAAGFIACAAWLAGVWLLPVYAAIHGAGVGMTLLFSRDKPSPAFWVGIVIAGVFVALLAADALEAMNEATGHGLTPEHAWEARWWLVMAQLLLVPLCIDWALVRVALRRLRPSPIDRVLKQVGLC